MTTTLFGYPAGLFDGVDDVLQLTDPSAWLNGVSAFTLLIDLEHVQNLTNTGFFRIGGTAAGADIDCLMALRSVPSSNFANPAVNNCYFAVQRDLVSAVNTLCRVEGEANRVQPGQPTCVALAWEAGAAQSVISHGIRETESYLEQATPGGTLIAGSGPLAFGAGPRAYWSGKIGFARIAKTRRSDAWIEGEQANRIDYQGTVACGATRLSNETVPCVAHPFETTLVGGPQVLTPLAVCTGTGLRIEAATASVGTLTINTAGTNLTYTPPAIPPQEPVRISYTIRDSLNRRSSSRAFLVATPIASIVSDQASVIEAGAGVTTNVTFQIRRVGLLTFASSVNWSVDTTALSSVNATDFVGGVLPSGTATWAIGDGDTKTITLALNGDATAELDEALRVALSAPVSCRIDPNAASASMILLDDDTVSPSIVVIGTATPTLVEGNAGQQLARFVVTRTVNLTSTCSVGWSRRTGGDNLQGNDFAGGTPPASGSIAFASGVDSMNLDFQVAGDALTENNETLTIDLAAGVGCLIGSPASSTITVTNDDTAATTLTITAAAPTVAEGGTTTFNILRSGPTTATSSVTWVRSGSANIVDLPGAPASAIVSFAIGVTSVPVNFSVANDTDVEGDETIIVTLSSGSAIGAVIGTPSSATVTIIDDDNPPIDDDYPPTVNEVTVENGAELSTAYLACENSTTIWLEDGPYATPSGGNWNFNRTIATAARPIVIRPVGNNWLGPVFNNRVVITGRDHVFVGAMMNQSLASSTTGIMQLAGSRSRISRCKINYEGTSSTFGIMCNNSAVDIRIDRCDIRIYKGNLLGAHGSGIKMRSAGQVLRPIVEYCYIHGFDGIGSNPNGHEGLAIGEGGNWATNVNAIVRFCLFEDMSNESEAISNKTSGNRFTNVIFNRGKSTTNLTDRTGDNSVWTACRVTNAGGFRSWMDGHIHHSCEVSGGASFQFLVGNATHQEWEDNYDGDDKNAYNRPAPTNCKLYRCSGRVEIADDVGAAFDTPVGLVTILNHRTPAADIVFVTNQHNGVTTTGTSPGALVPIVNLVSSGTGQNVGVYAP